MTTINKYLKNLLKPNNLAYIIILILCLSYLVFKQDFERIGLILLVLIGIAAYSYLLLNIYLSITKKTYKLSTLITIDVILCDKDLEGCDLLIGLDILQFAVFNYDGIGRNFSLSFPNFKSDFMDRK